MSLASARRRATGFLLDAENPWPGGARLARKRSCGQAVSFTLPVSLNPKIPGVRIVAAYRCGGMQLVLMVIVTSAIHQSIIFLHGLRY